MSERINQLVNKRKKIKEEMKGLSEEREQFNETSKRFNKTVFKVLLISIVLMLPMALYTIPIIPHTYVMAGQTMTGLAPILPKTIPLDLLMYPAFLGGAGFVLSSAALAIGNITYFLPMKIIGNSMENNLNQERKTVNRQMIEESRKNSVKSNYQQHNPKNKYSYNKTQLNHNKYQHKDSKEEIVRKAQERIKKRQLKKTSNI